MSSVRRGVGGFVLYPLRSQFFEPAPAVGPHRWISSAKIDRSKMAYPIQLIAFVKFSNPAVPIWNILTAARR
jgi:hypothetical protein